MSQIVLYAEPTSPVRPETLAAVHFPQPHPVMRISAPILVREVRAIRNDWASDGVPLDQVTIPVTWMIDELVDLLERVGIPDARAWIEAQTA